MLNLHLGCGDRLLKSTEEVRWVNIDLVRPANADYSINPDFEVGDITKVEYVDNSIDSIYCCHALDHLSRNKEVDMALSEWYRVLKPGGILRVAVSDFDKVVKMYNEGLDLERLWGHIVGGHKSSFDRHGAVFNFVVLRRYLEKHKFINIRRYDYREFLPTDFDDLSQCFIPHLCKTDGIIMSLNVEAYKPL